MTRARFGHHNELARKSWELFWSPYANRAFGVLKRPRLPWAWPLHRNVIEAIKWPRAPKPVSTP
jgi:hypothetical protein